MTTHLLHSDSLVERRHPGVADLKRLYVSLIVWLNEAYSRHRQRAVLASLDQHRLWDIGVTREQAVYEASKPFYRK